MSADDALERMQRRYERERRARLEAEAIAGRGLRDLYEANRSLDRRIAERTRELEEATRRAEAANAAKGQFLAHIGHELRTPISGIAGMLELLERTVTEPDAQRWVASARESSTSLRRLFDRILWFIDMESADLTAGAEPTDVEQLVRETADRWRVPCARAGQLLSVDVTTPPGAEVAATEELGRALDELADNAARHADPGAVRLRADRAGPRVRFAVEDSGPGIDERIVASASTVLDPGEAPETRHHVGAGIGLALVRRVADALGGAFGIDPVDGGGSLVWIAVPLAPTAEPAEE